MSTQVHRYWDQVSAWIGTGPSVYMTPAQARAMGQALIDAADDCDKRKYGDSSIPTFNGDTLREAS